MRQDLDVLRLWSLALARIDADNLSETMSRASSEWSGLLPCELSEQQVRKRTRAAVARYGNVCAALLDANVHTPHLLHYAREAALAVEVSLLGEESRFYEAEHAHATMRLVDTQIKQLSAARRSMPPQEVSTFGRLIIAHRFSAELLRPSASRPTTVADTVALQTLFFQSLGQLRSLQSMCALRDGNQTGGARCALRLPEHACTGRAEFRRLLDATVALKQAATKITPEDYMDALRAAFFFAVPVQTDTLL